jgi:hypothetical protein
MLPAPVSTMTAETEMSPRVLYAARQPVAWSVTR